MSTERFETVRNASGGGTGHYINDYRCGGSKPLGGGEVVASANLGAADIIVALTQTKSGRAALAAYVRRTAAPTQVEAGPEVGASSVIFDALRAIQCLFDWDAKRGFLLTYKVRDPLHSVLRTCIDFLAAQGGQEAEPVEWQSRFIGDAEWKPCSKEHHDWVLRALSEFEGHEVRALYTHPPRTQGDVDRLDAARWREALVHVGGGRNPAGRQTFILPYLRPAKGAKLMKGSVAEHFTNAIDAAIARQGGGQES